MDDPSSAHSPSRRLRARQCCVEKLAHAPHGGSNAGRHGGRTAERLVDAYEIVVREVKGDGRAVVLQLLGVGVRQPRKAADRKPSTKGV